MSGPKEHDEAERLYRRGLGCVGRALFDDAINFFNEAAAKGKVDALAQLGQMYLILSIIRKEHSEELQKKGFKALNEALEQGSKEAYYIMESLYQSDILGLPKDLNKANEMYKRSAELGHEGAQAIIAGIELEKQKKILIEELRSTDNPLEIYNRGRSLEVDGKKELAAVCYQKASAMGDIKAKTNLATLYLENPRKYSGLGIDAALEEATQLLSDASNKGHVRAMMRLADFYETNDLDPSNLNRARQLYEEAISLLSNPEKLKFPIANWEYITQSLKRAEQQITKIDSKMADIAAQNEFESKFKRHEALREQERALLEPKVVEMQRLLRASFPDIDESKLNIYLKIPQNAIVVAATKEIFQQLEDKFSSAKKIDPFSRVLTQGKYGLYQFAVNKDIRPEDFINIAKRINLKNKKADVVPPMPDKARSTANPTKTVFRTQVECTKPDKDIPKATIKEVKDLIRPFTSAGFEELRNNFNTHTSLVVKSPRPEARLINRKENVQIDIYPNKFLIQGMSKAAFEITLQSFMKRFPGEEPRITGGNPEHFGLMAEILKKKGFKPENCILSDKYRAEVYKESEGLLPRNPRLRA